MPLLDVMCLPSLVTSWFTDAHYTSFYSTTFLRHLPSWQWQFQTDNTVIFFSSKPIIIPTSCIFYFQMSKATMHLYRAEIICLGLFLQSINILHGRYLWMMTYIKSCPSLSNDHDRALEDMSVHKERQNTERVRVGQSPDRVHSMWRGCDIWDDVDCCPFHHLLHKVQPVMKWGR